jgi:predicted component of type VI protein secretion system
VRNGFADLRHHDTATQTALSTAMEQYLAHLDPTALEQRFADLERPDTEGDASTRRRFQDLYADMYRTLTQRSERGTVPTLFAAEFAKAYAAACRAETHPTGTTLASWGRQQAG